MAYEIVHADSISRTAAMVHDSEATELAKKHGLAILDVTWEDTGRSKGSSWGPNISDVCIQVLDTNDESAAPSCMPVIRHPNFSDKSCDISPEKFFLRVGNHKDQDLKVISLKEYLQNIQEYLSSPDKGSIKGPLFADRDTHVLASAQACFLPVPQKGKAQFNPVIFNYQSHKDNPAVLCILATCQGTSATIVDNAKDAYSSGWRSGQRIYHNKNGQKTKLTGERLKDVEAKLSEGIGASDASVPPSADLVLLIQVPLVHNPPAPRKSMLLCSTETYGSKGMGILRSRSMKSDVDRAVIGFGEEEGEYSELNGLTIERDTRFPIRVTVQFYKATSNGVIDERDVKDIADSLNRVYESSDYVGSLVTEGNTARPTEHAGPKTYPAIWWPTFWERHCSRFSTKEEDVMSRFQTIFGDQWKAFSLDEAENVLRSERLF